jgi:hypothetical protein
MDLCEEITCQFQIKFTTEDYLQMWQSITTTYEHIYIWYKQLFKLQSYKKDR